eukprot:5696137-Amphidinium_carterae.1
MRKLSKQARLSPISSRPWRHKTDSTKKLEGNLDRLVSNHNCLTFSYNSDKRAPLTQQSAHPRTVEPDPPTRKGTDKKQLASYVIAQARVQFWHPYAPNLEQSGLFSHATSVEAV